MLSRPEWPSVCGENAGSVRPDVPGRVELIPQGVHQRGSKREARKH